MQERERVCVGVCLGERARSCELPERERGREVERARGEAGCVWKRLSERESVWGSVCERESVCGCGCDRKSVCG